MLQTALQARTQLKIAAVETGQYRQAGLEKIDMMPDHGVSWLSERRGQHRRERP